MMILGFKGNIIYKFPPKQLLNLFSLQLKVHNFNSYKLFIFYFFFEPRN